MSFLRRLEIKCFAIGAAAGGAGALVGLGGGFIAVPAMTQWTGLSQHAASANSLGTVIATGIAGTVGYMRSGHDADMRIATAMAAAGMMSSTFGAKLTTRMSGRSLKLALGLLMIGVSPLLPLRGQLLDHKAKGKSQQQEQHEDETEERLLVQKDGCIGGKVTERTEGKETAKDQQKVAEVASLTVSAKETGNGLMVNFESAALQGDYKGMFSTLKSQVDAGKWTDMLIAAAIGSVSGLLAGMFGVGGGVIIVPLMSYTLPDLDHYEVIATSLASMVLPAMVGSVTHFKQGTLQVKLVMVPLAVGTLVGAYCGSKFAGGYVAEKNLQLTFSAFMAVLGLRTVQKALDMPAGSAVAKTITKRPPKA